MIQSFQHGPIDPCEAEFLFKQPRPTSGYSVVPAFAQFQRNFAAFTSGQLVDFDYSNCIVLGGAVLASLMPLEEKIDCIDDASLQKYYLERYASADIDIFCYGFEDETQNYHKKVSKEEEEKSKSCPLMRRRKTLRNRKKEKKL